MDTANASPDLYAKKYGPLIAEIRTRLELCFGELISGNYSVILPHGKDSDKDIHLFACVGEPCQTSKTDRCISISAESKSKMIDIAIVLYLLEWLENDLNAKETVTHFATHYDGVVHSVDKVHFTSVSETERSGGKNLAGSDKRDPSVQNHMQRREIKYYNMTEIQKQDAIHAGFRARKNTAYRKISKELKAKNNSVETANLRYPGGGGNWYSFTDLYFMDQLIDSDIFFLLADSKKPIYMGSPKKENNERLKAAYTDYWGRIQKLREISDPKTYVIATIAHYKMEMSFAPLLAAHIAWCAEQYSSLAFEDVFNATWPWHMRFSFPSTIRRPQTPNANAIVHQYDIWSSMLICNMLSGTEEQLCKNAFKHILEQSLILDLIMCMNHISPPTERPSCTNQDYINISEFFKCQYPAFDCFYSNLPPVETWPDTMLNNIRRFYQNISDYGYEDMRVRFRMQSKTHKKI